MKKIAVLKTTINGRINYVGASMQTHGLTQKKIVSYTTDPHGAKEFDSLEMADSFICRIHNPHERLFFPGEVEVDPKNIQSQELAEEHLR